MSAACRQSMASPSCMCADCAFILESSRCGRPDAARRNFQRPILDTSQPTQCLPQTMHRTHRCCDQREREERDEAAAQQFHAEERGSQHQRQNDEQGDEQRYTQQLLLTPLVTHSFAALDQADAEPWIPLCRRIHAQQSSDLLVHLFFHHSSPSKACSFSRPRATCDFTVPSGRFMVAEASTCDSPKARHKVTAAR